MDDMFLTLTACYCCFALRNLRTIKNLIFFCIFALTLMPTLAKLSIGTLLFISLCFIGLLGYVLVKLHEHLSKLEAMLTLCIREEQHLHEN